MPSLQNESQICVSAKFNKYIDISNTKTNVIDMTSAVTGLIIRQFLKKTSDIIRFGDQNMGPIPRHLVSNLDTVNKEILICFDF